MSFLNNLVSFVSMGASMCSSVFVPRGNFLKRKITPPQISPQYNTAAGQENNESGSIFLLLKKRQILQPPPFQVSFPREMTEAGT